MRNITATFSEKRHNWVGDGFPVRSLLSHERAGGAASPFLLLDYAAPYQFEPKSGNPRGVGAHPHKGFETVTIVYDGEVEHRDSTGAGGVIGPGDVQWMTAGRGIMHQEFHSEAFTRKGGTMEMVQLWVNLPRADKNAEAGYQNITSDIIPVVQEDGVTTRVIAGQYRQTKGPTRTFTPINLWDMDLKANQTLDLAIPTDHNSTILVLRGEIRIADKIFSASQSLVMAPGEENVTLETLSNAKILVLSGAPIDEPIVQYGPFVMNSQAEIREAIKEFNAGKFGRL